MKKINLNTNSPYEILIDKNLLQYSGNHIKNFSSAKQVLIITDDIVNELYSNKLTESLINCGFEVFLFVIAHGEASKNLQTVGRIYSFLVKNKFIKASVFLLALFLRKIWTK